MAFLCLPFPTARSHYLRLAKLGSELIDAHILKQVPDGKLGKYYGKGSHKVQSEHVRYVESEQTLFINKEDQCFRPIPRSVWEFKVGGYDAIAKFLAAREGRILSLDEIEKVEQIVNVLAFTMEHMKRIDSAYLAAFPE